MRKHALFLAALALPALAAPPPGHPSVERAGEILHLPTDDAAELPLSGIVVSSLDANNYTYVEVEQQGQRRWLAAPLTRLTPGQVVRYDEGTQVFDWYSRKLRRTFQHLTFIKRLQVAR